MMEKDGSMASRVVAKLKHYAKNGLKLFRAPWAVRRLKNDLFDKVDFALSRIDSLLMASAATLEHNRHFVQDLSAADAERQKQLMRQFQALGERIDRLEELCCRHEEQLDRLLPLFHQFHPGP